MVSVGMMSFHQLWKRIDEHYRDNADALDVPPEQILPGRLGNLGPAPLVYTYLIPSRIESGGAWALVKTVVAVPAAVDLVTGMRDAVALAGRAMRVLKGVRIPGLQWTTTAPVFEAADADNVVVSFDVIAPYDPMAE